MNKVQITTTGYHLLHQAILLGAIIAVSLLLASNPSADDIYKPLIGYLIGMLGRGGISAVIAEKKE